MALVFGLVSRGLEEVQVEMVGMVVSRWWKSFEMVVEAVVLLSLPWVT